MASDPQEHPTDTNTPGSGDQPQEDEEVDLPEADRSVHAPPAPEED